MKIELAFENVPNDIESAVADIHIEDQSEADAPSLQLFSKRFAIQQLQPTITVDMDLNVPDANRELTILVRVKAQTQSNQPIEFLNTTTTPLPKDLNGSVQVMLSRIA